TTCQPIYKKISVYYKIVQGKKPAWKTFGQCKAVAVLLHRTEKRRLQNLKRPLIIFTNRFPFLESLGFMDKIIRLLQIHLQIIK
ncbi:MAG TPA: hypothetical protein DIS88_05075, partial [Prevotella sp.]|nr:hypothetical protein [Prevotella sp.]